MPPSPAQSLRQPMRAGKASAIPPLARSPHTGRPVADLWHVEHREREDLKRVLAYSAKGAADLQVYFDRGGASVANKPRGRDRVVP